MGRAAAFYGLLKKEAPETFKNVYFDTAASPYIYRPVIYRVVADMVGPEKVIFGSDYPLLPPSRYVKEMGEANLPEDWQEMILGKNGAVDGGLAVSGQWSAIAFFWFPSCLGNPIDCKPRLRCP